MALDRVRVLRILAINVRRREAGSRVDLIALGFDSQTTADQAVTAVNDADQVSSRCCLRTRAYQLMHVTCL